MAGPQLLVLARHARPAVDPTVASTAWPLDDGGRDAALRLGEAWRPLELDLVASSTERKAMETAAIAARVLDVTFQTGHDLHEHERPFIADRDAFLQQMRAFFADEAAMRQVERRFSSAVDALVKVHRGLRIAIVSHGTVLALHLAARYGLDAAATWDKLGMPSYVVVELTTKSIVDVVATV